jgi:hypothetical protein
MVKHPQAAIDSTPPEVLPVLRRQCLVQVSGSTLQESVPAPWRVVAEVAVQPEGRPRRCLLPPFLL